MKSTSSWLIFCIAGSLLVLSMLVPYLWNPQAQQIALSDRADRKQVAAVQVKPAPAAVTPTAPDPVPGTVHRPPPEPLVILPAVATMPREETNSQLPPPLSIPLEPGVLARTSLPRSLATPDTAGIIKFPISPPVISTGTPMDPTIGRRTGPWIGPTSYRPEGRFPPRATETMTSEIRGWQGARWPYPDRLVRRLQARGNDVYVIVGPLNQHKLTEANRVRFLELENGAAMWLKKNGIQYWVADTLPSGSYADASHPLTRGYRELAEKMLDQESFTEWIAH